MNNYFKITSTLLTVLLFLSIIGLFLTYFSSHSETEAKHYISNNENRIQVELATKKVEKKIVKKDKPIKKRVKEKKKKPEKIQKSEKPIEKKNLKNLFDDVKDKKPKRESQKEKEKKAEKIRAQEKEKEENKKVEKEKEKKRKEAKAREKEENIKKMKEKEQGIVNDYFAKVEEILYYWPALSEFAGEKAEVWLKIRRDGSFDFKLIRPSNNQDFNSGLIQYLEQLQRVGFAVHKSNKPYEANVEFVAEE